MKKRLVILLFGIIFLVLTLTYAATFSDSSQTDFNSGAYNATFYNTSGFVQLSNGNLTGNYTSRIFDSSSVSRWDNLSSNKNVPSADTIYSVDAQAKTYYSLDNGTNWILKNSSYIGVTPGDTQDIFVDAVGSLYIIKSGARRIFRSDDKGFSWNMINSTFANKDLFTGTADMNNIYVFAGTGEGAVYFTSSDRGVSWSSAKVYGGGTARAAVINSSNAVYVVDNTGAVYVSTNSGTTWVLKNSGYGRTTDTHDMFLDSSNNLYILASSNKEVWKSTNSGTNWNVVNNTFSGSASLNAGIGDHYGNIYTIAGANGLVYKSVNSGTNWNAVNNSYNGGNGNSRAMVSLILQTNLTFQARNCSSANCADGNFIGPDSTSNSYFTNLTNVMNLTGRYFQYRSYFSRDDLSIQPVLNNVSIEYTILDNLPPNLTIVSPLAQNYTNASILVNISAVDNTAVSMIWFYNGSANITYTTSNTYIFSQGTTTLIAYANDTLGNLNSSSVSFFVDSITPSVAINHPLNISYSATTTTLNYSVSDVNLRTCKYSLNNGLINTTITCGNNVSSIPITEGSNTIILYVDDSLGNMNSSSVTFIRDTIPPLLSLLSPQNISYTSNNISINITNSSDAQTVWFYNGSTNVTYTKIISQLFSEGSNRVIAYTNDSVNNINSSSVTFVVDSLGPNINIDHPQESFIYGRNNSLSLNFSVSDAVSSVSSCRYNIDNGANKTLNNCLNTTFNVTGDGSHTLYFFANDSLGNSNNKSVSFSVLTNAPALNLISPSNNSYLNYTNNIYFNYSVISGIGVSSCQFWGDFNGNWTLNQTNSSIVTENNFFLNGLPNGNYLWGIICNDTLNRKASANNTLYIDTITPELTLSQPSGTKTSRTGISLTFSINDSSPTFCKYNVFRGSSIEIGNTSVDCSLGSSSFDVTVDADFILNFYVNDSAGNANSKSSSFSVDTSTPISPPPSGGGGGGGGGGSSNRNYYCTENWTCLDWDVCNQGIQTRNCIDKNKCGSIIKRPETQRECIACTENWTCGNWTECDVEGVQIRACDDENNCGITLNKPIEIKSCTIPTCSDDIQNQGELGVDCGGPCADRCVAGSLIGGRTIAIPPPDQSKKTYSIALIINLCVLMGFLFLRNKYEMRLEHDSIKYSKFYKKIFKALHILILLGVGLLIYYIFK